MNDNQIRKRNGRAWAGIFLLGVGVVLLLQRMGVFFPYWLFTWPVLLILAGVFIGLGHNFRGVAWLIMIFVGSVFLFDNIMPEYSLRRYIWPLIFIIIGLVMILKPRRSPWGDDWRRRRFAERQGFYPHSEMKSDAAREAAASETVSNAETDTGDYINSTAVFGGIRKVILSKNFRGGEAVSVFGGNEIDLSKADINGTVQLELTQVFGGTKLIVPNHWNIKSEVVAFLGGIEDKRLAETSQVDPSKTLILKGTSVLGGIDIRSY